MLLFGVSGLKPREGTAWDVGIGLHRGGPLQKTAGQHDNFQLNNWPNKKNCKSHHSHGPVLDWSCGKSDEWGGGSGMLKVMEGGVTEDGRTQAWISNYKTLQNTTTKLPFRHIPGCFIAKAGSRRCRQSCSDGDDGRSDVAPEFFMDEVMPWQWPKLSWWGRSVMTRYFLACRHWYVFYECRM